MLLLKDAELESLLSPLQLTEAVERAIISDEQNENLVPQRMHINRTDNTYLLMPAYGSEVFGTKLVSVIPSNANACLPVISGLYSLNDNQTGSVRALMSASKLTALRTGAIAAVAIRALTNQNTMSIGIVGPGVQAIWIAICAAAVRPLKKIFVLGRSKTSLNNFFQKVRMRLPEIEIIEVEDSKAILKNTDTIITVTTSDAPVLPNDCARLEGKTFIAMGSYRKNMRELPDAAFQLSGQILIDAPGTRFEVGDVLYPLEKQLVNPENVVTLGSLLTGKNHITAPTKVFKSAGYALFDLFVAEKLYKAAVSQRKGQQFTF